MPTTQQESSSLRSLIHDIHAEEALLRQGGGSEGRARQKKLGRMTVRERLGALLDPSSKPLELNLWAGYGMYKEWGALPAAGVVTTIGKVSGRDCMVIANDATVKAGAMFPQSVKKVLRAQRIAFECRLPVIFLVDSSGVFLPLQEDVFPDEDDFGRIFRNNAIFSAAGIQQFAAIMGNCIAGGAYLPVLCDQLLMTEGSGLYLAGPALVKAAIGQIVDTEELGGAIMHSTISGTVDFLEKDDASCIQRLRKLVEMLPQTILPAINKTVAPASSDNNLYDLVSGDNKKPYDVRHVIDCLVDGDSFEEYKALFGKTIVTGYAKIGGMPIGIVANQRLHETSGQGELQLGGVLYSESSDKAARFVMDCNQFKIPLLFLQDVVGFMIGKNAEHSGIIRSGAKLVNAVSNSIIPKITIIIGNSFGAGNYALCGKAYDPNFIFAWPNAKYAVMGADQASDTLFAIQQKTHAKNEQKGDAEKMRESIKEKYLAQTNIRYGAARGWIDGIIAPEQTRGIIIECLRLLSRSPYREKTFHTGVLQV